MTLAFGGDPATKAGLLATIDRHVATGTLRFGTTKTGEAGGTPLGIATGGMGLDTYVAAYGYPPALAGLLDPLAAMIGTRDSAVRFVRDWVSLVEPGADLTAVPAAIVLDLLEASETRSLIPDIVEPLATLHRRERDGDEITRREWAACRRIVLTATDMPQPGPVRGLLDLCEAACWSSRSSRSILVTMAVKWCDLSEFVADPTWQDGDRIEARQTLHALWQRHASDEPPVSIAALFAAQAPDLARRFEANLVRVNAYRPQRVDQLAAMVLSHLGAVSPLPA